MESSSQSLPCLSFAVWRALFASPLVTFRIWFTAHATQQDHRKLIHIPGNCRSQTSSADWDAQSGHVTTGGGWDVGFYMTSESNVWFCQSNSSLMMLAASVSYVTLILQVHSMVRCTLLHHMTFSHSSPPILSFSSPLFFCTITPSIFHPLICSFLPVLLHSDRSLLSASIHRR